MREELAPPPIRKPLSKKIRFEVFKRDSFTCVYCGRRPPTVVLHCDHVMAVANGGPNDIDNLVTSCEECNLGKGARELTAIPLTVAEKAERLREREEQIAAFNAAVFEKQERIEAQAWILAEMMMRQWSLTGIPNPAFNSLQRFVNLMPIDELIDAAYIAFGRFPSPSQCERGFKYFCGICWSKIRDTSAED